jgi:hypothetical protein
MRIGLQRGAVVAFAAVVLALAVVPLAAAVPRTAPLGSTFIVTGQTGSSTGSKPTVGPVVVNASWNGGPWRTLTTTRTDRNGRYRVVVRLRQRGLLNLRVVPPDGDAHWFTLRVV